VSHLTAVIDNRADGGFGVPRSGDGGRSGSGERAANTVAYLDRTAKRVKRSASAVLSDLVAEAARQEARDRALDELGAGVEISEREVQRWLKKLGAA
jgi:hypothetical protein